MTIKASQVKELRQATGVGMMECKKALVETSGDLQKAIVWLRERGLSRAQKKAGRTAAEGIISLALSSDNKAACLVEINCETDFAAKNADFLSFANEMASLALESKVTDIESLKAQAYKGSTVAEQLTQLIAKVGENMNLRRLKLIEASAEGFVVAYDHMQGKIGSLVALKGEFSEQGKELGLDLAMHVAAAAPRYLDRTLVKAEELEQEKEIARNNLKKQGKPDELIEKILLGQVNKFYGEVTFVDQPFIKEPKLSVTKYVQQSGLKLEIADYARFQLGDGIEVEKKDFAQEVSDQLK